MCQREPLGSSEGCTDICSEADLSLTAEPPTQREQRSPELREASRRLLEALWLPSVPGAFREDLGSFTELSRAETPGRPLSTPRWEPQERRSDGPNSASTPAGAA
jgi:hypothetical protein